MNLSIVLLIIGHILMMLIIVTCITLVINRFRKKILYNIIGKCIHVTIKSDAIINIDNLPYDFIDIEIDIADTRLTLVSCIKIKRMSISGKNTQLIFDNEVLECEEIKIKGCFTECNLKIFLITFEILQCRFNGSVEICHVEKNNDYISKLNLIQDVEFNAFTYDSKLCESNIKIIETLFKKKLIHVIPIKNDFISYSHSKFYEKVLYFSENESELKLVVEFCNYFSDMCMHCKKTSLVYSSVINSSFRSCILDFESTKSTLIENTSFDSFNLICDSSNVDLLRIQSSSFNNMYIKANRLTNTFIVNNVIEIYMSFDLKQSSEHIILYGNIIKQCKLPTEHNGDLYIHN